MIQSYQEEIRAKRVAARIFWLVVFVFAGFLYFFFQGYYPSVDFRLTHILGTESVSGEEWGVTIRSFGIVNVKSIPNTSSLVLNNNPYGNDEKKMVDYGDYTLTISGEWYLPGVFHFAINREKPYYIDAINLMPTPRYALYKKELTQISKIDTNTWTANSASGILLFEWDFSTGILIGSWNTTPIGEWRFLSGNTIVSYDLLTRSWVTEENDSWESFVKKCNNTVLVKHLILLCPKKAEAISSEGKLFTGVLDIEKQYIRTKLGIIPYENMKFKKNISLSGITIDQNSQFISIENQWYYTQSGILISLTGEKNHIRTPLDTIRHVEQTDTNLLVFGKRWINTFLTFLDVNNPLRTRTIPFPDISLDEIRIMENQGNLLIKTQSALLLIYHGSDEIHWIVDGEILALWEDFTLYRKDGEIWWATWKNQKLR